MSVLELDYSDMSDIVDAANGLASKAEEYAEKLTQRFSKKIDDVTGGMNGHLSSANYYVNAKIKDLNAKQSKYKSFASKVEKLATVAKDMDKKVAKTITDNKERFLEVNKHLKVSDIKAWFIEKWVSFKNLNPIFEKIGNIIDEIDTGIDELKSGLKEFYRYGGGKEICEIIKAVATLAFSIAILVCAILFPPAGAASLVIIAGLVSKSIDVLDSAVTVKTSIMAFQQKRNGNPAMAKYIGDQESTSDFLRKNNFHNKFFNKASNVVASVLDETKAEADAIDLFGSIKGFASESKLIGAIKDQKGKYNGLNKFKKNYKAVTEGFKDYKNTHISTSYVKNIIKDNLNLKEMYKETESRKDFFEILKDGTELTIDGLQSEFDEQDIAEKVAKRVSQTAGLTVDSKDVAKEYIDMFKEN